MDKNVIITVPAGYEVTVNGEKVARGVLFNRTVCRPGGCKEIRLAFEHNVMVLYLGDHATAMGDATFYGLCAVVKDAKKFMEEQHGTP